MTRGSRLVVIAALLMVGAGCTSALTLPTPSPRTVLPPLDSPLASAEPRTVNVKIEDIDREFTTPLLDATTDGRSILWSSGAPDGEPGPAPDLWRYSPGDARPERVYANPERDAVLSVIGGDGAGSYAFIEQNVRTLEDGGWRLWYIEEGKATPHLVDEGDVKDGLLPFFTLSADRLVWATLHEGAGGVESQLREMDTTSRATRVLLTMAPENSEIMYPSLDGSNLVYSVLSANANRTAVSSQAFLLELETEDSQPELLSGSENAFMAVIHGDRVVWQRPLLESPLNGGELVVHSLQTGETYDLELGQQGILLNYHTVGNRYVAADSEIVNRLYLYDLFTDEVVLVEDLGDDPEGERVAVDVRPRIDDDLLVFVRGSDMPDVELILKWAALPPLPSE